MIGAINVSSMTKKNRDFRKCKRFINKLYRIVKNILEQPLPYYPSGGVEVKGIEHGKEVIVTKHGKHIML